MVETIGEIDAYCSLATFAYNHPDYIYPTIAAQSFHLQAEALGHPLMDRNQCVRNGIDIEKRPFFIITQAQYGRQEYLFTYCRSKLSTGMYRSSRLGKANENISGPSRYQPSKPVIP